MMKYRIYSALLLISIIAIYSCTKTNVQGDNSPTHIRLINAMPTKSFDLKLNQTALMSNIGYDSATPFANGAPGFYQVDITDHNSGAAIITGNQYLQAGKMYSLFLVPDSTQGSDSARLSVVADNNIIPQFDSAKVRFLHFSPNTPAVNFVEIFQHGTSNVFDTISLLPLGRSYFDNSINSEVAQYLPIHINTYRFGFLSTDDPRIQVYPPILVTIEKDKFYTFYMEGYKGRTGADSLKVKMIVNP